ncbi:MAG: hypothetical protein FJZ75_10130 [Bacteroidetes bacterium]|nr:hypothetical protein [Bacteroidota bacterium]
MKPKNLLWACLIIPFTALGQGSLQFNQVKLVTTVQTVPANKVWKVESVIFPIPADDPPFVTSGSTGCSFATHRNYAISIDGTLTKVGNLASGFTNSSFGHFFMTTTIPVWLPAGATLSGGPCNNKISVIEFNIVP